MMQQPTNDGAGKGEGNVGSKLHVEAMLRSCGTRCINQPMVERGIAKVAREKEAAPGSGVEEQWHAMQQPTNTFPRFDTSRTWNFATLNEYFL